MNELKGLDIFQVDAFADQPFAGNPAAVCLLKEPRDEQWMQNVGMEMNLSETAFLLSQEDGYSLRWFTPAAEVDLCGHATLASAHVIWESGLLDASKEVRFFTRSGLLTAVKKDEWIELNFPAEPAEQCTPPEGLIAALGVSPRYVGRISFSYLVEVDSEEEVRQLRPDMGLLAAIPDRGVMVTSRASMPGYDFVSRFFAPGVGILEDPVTGSTHCCLGPYWAERLKKDELVAFQASSRGGTVRVRTAGERVLLQGQAITVLSGKLLA